ncbi:hypothetical protein V2G26_004488 [Clonostachys chloroleuca]
MELARGREADFGRWQKPEYMLAPNYNIPPDGPFALGRFVKEIDKFRVLNAGSARVHIPESDWYSDVKPDIQVSVNSSSNYDTNILAQFLDRSLGGNIGLQRVKNNSESFNVQKLETVFFDHTEEYILKCRELPDIQTYLQIHDYQVPIYLITGLKFAWGATRSVARDQDSGQETGAGVTLGPEALNLEVKGEASRTKNASFTADTKTPRDFIVGIRVEKFYHKKGWFFFGERTPHNKPETARAVFLDGDYREERMISSSVRS